MAKQKFKIGDKVQYSLDGKVLFEGTIIDKDGRKGYKSNIIKATDGSTKYANSGYLTKIKEFSQTL